MPTVLTAAAKIRDLLSNWNFPHDAPEMIGASEYVDSELIDFVKRSKSPKGLYNDPTYLGFNIMFDWYESPLFKGGLSADVNFERFSTESYQSQNISSSASFPAGSALNFFQKNGMDDKVLQFATFIQQLNFVNYNMPWYWQTITGLDTAIKKMENFRTTPYRGGSDSIITINTLESMDFMIQGISDLYKRSVDDIQYRREILPDNLRKFDIYFYINDVRKFQLSTEAKKVGVPSTHDKIKENMPKMIIKFTGCKFVYHDNSTIFETVSNVSAEMATNSISFKYDDLQVITDIPGFYASINSNGRDATVVTDDRSIFAKLASKLAQSAIDEAKKLGARALRNAVNAAINAAKKLILANIKMPWNNVYGGSYGALSKITSGNVGAVAEGAYNKSGINNKYLNNAFGITNTNAPSAAGTPDIGDSLFQGQASDNQLTNTSMQFPKGTSSYIPGRNSNVHEVVASAGPEASYIDLNLTNVYDE